jgi:hypothetical protein
MTTLEGSRVRLRPATRADIPALVPMDLLADELPR